MEYIMVSEDLKEWIEDHYDFDTFYLDEFEEMLAKEKHLSGKAREKLFDEFKHKIEPLDDYSGKVIKRTTKGKLSIEKRWSGKQFINQYRDRRSGRYVKKK